MENADSLDVLHPPEALLAQSQCFIRPLALRDVDEGDHHTLDTVLRRAVGEYSNQIPAVAVAAHFPLHRDQLAQYLARIISKRGFAHPVCQIRHRPTLVGTADVE